MRWKLLAILLGLLASPAFAAGRWNIQQIGPGSCSTFTFDSDDAGDAQPALRTVPGDLLFTSVATNDTAVDLDFYVRENDSDTPSTGGSLLANVTATSRAPTSVTIGGGLMLDVDIDTDGDGGSVTVCATGIAKSGLLKQPLSVTGEPGTIWLQDAKLADLGGRTRRQAVDPILGYTSSAGFESCFNDFTNAWDYSITRSTAFNGMSAATTTPSFPALVGFSGSATYDPASLADGAGATTTITVTGAALGDWVEAVSFSLDLQGITLTAWVSAANTVSVRFQNESGGVLDLASGTIRAHVRETDPILDATAFIPASWGRLDIGAPATVSFFGRRSGGAQDEIDSRVTVAVGTNATGVIFFNPYCGWGTSTGSSSSRRLFGGAWRVRRDSGTAANGCIFMGWTNSVIGLMTPLTTACAASATANDIYFGVRTDTSGNIRVVMNQDSSFQLDYDSGYDFPSNTHAIIEARGFYENDVSGAWIAGFVDFYVNGKLLRQAGRSHSIEPSDMTTPFNPITNPMAVSIALVRVSSNPIYQWDYVGALQSRQAQSTTP